MLERARGIEPPYAAWEAAILPMNYARKRYAGPWRYGSKAVLPDETAVIITRFGDICKTKFTDKQKKVSKKVVDIINQWRPPLREDLHWLERNSYFDTNAPQPF